jgi:integrase
MRSTINSILKRSAKDGYSYSVHDFRHSFATNCFLANRNPKIVQKELGHNSYEITINTYTHLPKLDPKDLENVKKYFTM